MAARIGQPGSPEHPQIPDLTEGSSWEATASKIAGFVILSVIVGIGFSFLWGAEIGVVTASIGIIVSIAMSLLTSTRRKEPSIQDDDTYLQGQTTPAGSPLSSPRRIPGQGANSRDRESPFHPIDREPHRPAPLPGQGHPEPVPFHPIEREARPPNSKEENLQIFRETMQVAGQFFVLRNQELAQSVTMPDKLFLRGAPIPQYQDCRLWMNQLSTFEATRDLRRRGLNPLVLNMANKRFPGGGVKRGDFGQEEALGRATNMMYGLEEAEQKRMYPIPDGKGILLKKVLFLRDDHQFLPQQELFDADVFALPAYDCNPGHRSGYDKPDVGYEQNTMEKIRQYLRVAIWNGNDSIIAGAFGCGAYKNDPQFIANCFNSILREPEFDHQFQEIVFAIRGQPGGRNQNYETFRRTLLPD